jgi:hypothetical protein
MEAAGHRLWSRWSRPGAFSRRLLAVAGPRHPLVRPSPSGRRLGEMGDRSAASTATARRQLPLCPCCLTKGCYRQGEQLFEGGAMCSGFRRRRDRRLGRRSFAGSIGRSAAALWWGVSGQMAGRDKAPSSTSARQGLRSCRGRPGRGAVPSRRPKGRGETWMCNGFINATFGICSGDRLSAAA